MFHCFRGFKVYFKTIQWNSWFFSPFFPQGVMTVNRRQDGDIWAQASSLLCCMGWTSSSPVFGKWLLASSHQSVCAGHSMSSWSQLPGPLGSKGLFLVISVVSMENGTRSVLLCHCLWCKSWLLVLKLLTAPVVALALWSQDPFTFFKKNCWEPQRAFVYKSYIYHYLLYEKFRLKHLKILI